MQLWAWCDEIQTQSTGFHGQGMVYSLFIHLFDMTANSSTHPLCNGTAYLYPGTVARQKSPPFTGRHTPVHQLWSLAGPQRPMGSVRAWTTTHRAPLTCCSALLRGVYLQLYLSPHQSPIFIKMTISSYRDRLAGEESVMKILREGSHHGSPLFNERIFWEQSIKMARHLSDRWVSENFSVSTRKSKKHLNIE